LKLTTLHHHLPQGAPTSSMLANLALLPIHDEIAAVATEFDLRWSFYVDDIALSGSRAREAITPVVDIIHRHGHSVHDVRVMSAGARHELTGTVPNRKISVGQSSPGSRHSRVYSRPRGAKGHSAEGVGPNQRADPSDRLDFKIAGGCAPKTR
jgi:hypothetical protein